MKKGISIFVLICLTCFQLFADNLIDNFKIYHLNKEVIAALNSLHSDNCFENDDYIFYFMNDGSGIIFCGYKGDKKDVTIPDEIEGFPVTEIVYFGKSVERVVIPKTVKKIGDMAFFGCGITKVDFEENSQLEEIRKRAFAYNRLTEINLPRKKIKLYSHEYFMNPIKEITYYKEWDCWYESYRERFFDYGFEWDSLQYEFIQSERTPFECLPLLEKVIFEEGCERVEEYMFSMCPKLSQVEFPGTIRNVLKEAFTTCPSLKVIIIPDKVNKINGSDYNEIIFDGRNFDIETVKKLLKAGFTMKNIGR